MEVSSHLYGGFPYLKKYQVAEDFANAGVLGTIDIAGEGGVNLGTTANAVDTVGVTIDTGVYSNTQGTGTSTAETLVTFDIRPDVVLRTRLSGGATSGTAMVVQTNTSENTGGVTITTGAAWDSVTYQDGTVWGLTGNNVGQSRKITTVSGTVGTVVVPFDYTIAANDTFLRARIHPHEVILLQLTSDLTEVDSDADPSSDAELACIGMDLKGVSDSYAYLTVLDHYLNPT